MMQNDPQVPTFDAPRRPRVLLVDDNLTHLDLYALVMHSDFDVITASRGESAYAVAVEQRPDAMVIDAVLPDLDGLDLCQRLLADSRTAATPLLVLTGNDAAFARARTMPSLAAVLTKPCPGDTLLAAIHQALGHQPLVL